MIVSGQNDGPQRTGASAYLTAAGPEGRGRQSAAVRLVERRMEYRGTRRQ